MGVDGTFYTPVPDSACMSKARFIGTETWFAWANNNRHFVASRGRVLVKSYDMDYAYYNNAGNPLPALAEVARFVVDRTPEENVIYTRLLFTPFPVGGEQPMIYAWRVDTDDTTGLQNHAGEGAQQLGYTRRDSAVVINSRRDGRALNFRGYRGTLPEAHFFAPTATPWQKHTVPDATSRTGTVIKIMAASTGPELAGLWGICCVGFRVTD